MTALEVVRCGPLAALQDTGRPGLARLGIPRSGAMDPRALSLANALVGNAAGEAAIELAWSAIELRASGGPARLAVAGAPAAVRVGGCVVPHHAAFTLEEGETVMVARADEGVFTMLAAAGGFDVAPVLASRSLYTRGGIGGVEGRGLRTGDTLKLRPADRDPGPLLRAAPVVIDSSAAVLRVVRGPEHSLFTATAYACLFGQTYRLGEQSDRMAYRLSGAPLERERMTEMISTGTLPGAIQVPPDGQPLVLMADCQTIGGYPRIAMVIAVDLPLLAQCRPGASINFTEVGVAEAHRLLREAASRPAATWTWAGTPSAEPSFAALAQDCRDNTVDALNPATWA
ncbi:MAG: biotin-dependent carboxyltransferase family protein [Hyphomicrobiaceae bacterium]|nr:biotin-dependent carboxyltransferase family protein [Hyphomicrobiaceae bacterium]